MVDIEQAQDFYTVERAINQKNKTPGKCTGYYFIDTNMIENEELKESVATRNKNTVKRKNFSVGEV